MEQFLNYFYCVKHLQRVAFGTMKFNRLIELLGFKSFQLCSNAILLRSSAVPNSFQFCVTQILMICQYCKTKKKPHIAIKQHIWNMQNSHCRYVFSLNSLLLFPLEVAASVLLIPHATAAFKIRLWDHSVET